jgi:glycosyltransferase involved in cell wall biosynthesis
LALAEQSKVFENKLKIILKSDFDYVFFEGLQTAQYLGCIKHSTTILDLQNPEHIILKNLYTRENNIIKKSFLKTQLEKIKSYELSQVKKFDKVFTVSRKDSHHISMAGSYNNFVVPNGCTIYDIDFIFKPNLLYVGSLDYLPNEEGLLWFLENVFPKVKDNSSNITFYIIGRNPSKKIRQFESENIKVLDYVEDIIPYYNKTSLFIVPLLVSGGQRLKILHAMSFKKCVVSTRIGAESLDMEENRDIFLADDADTFANKVIGLLNNPQLVRDAGEKGYNLVKEKYDWKEISKSVVAILEGK